MCKHTVVKTLYISWVIGNTKVLNRKGDFQPYLIQLKDGIRSLNQECVYGISSWKRREEYQSMTKDKVVEQSGNTLV